MAYVDNSETKKEINDAIRGNATSNIAPNSLANQVIPVIDVNPKNFRRINIVRRATSSTTIYTTPADKDFYLCGYQLVLNHGTAAQTGSITLAATPKGEANVVVAALQYTTTALIDVAISNNSQNFNQPILLERNSAITSATTGTAPSGRSYIIYGYTVEP